MSVFGVKNSLFKQTEGKSYLKKIASYWNIFALWYCNDKWQAAVTVIDVRFWRLKSIATLKELTI